MDNQEIQNKFKECESILLSSQSNLNKIKALEFLLEFSSKDEDLFPNVFEKYLTEYSKLYDNCEEFRNDSINDQIITDKKKTIQSGLTVDKVSNFRNVKEFLKECEATAEEFLPYDKLNFQIHRKLEPELPRKKLSHLIHQNFNKPCLENNKNNSHLQNNCEIYPSISQNINKFNCQENLLKQNHEECLPTSNCFKSARQLYLEENKNCPQIQSAARIGLTKNYNKKRSTNSSFVPVVSRNDQQLQQNKPDNIDDNIFENEVSTIMDDRLKHFDKKLVEMIMSEIVSKSEVIEWSDIAGLKMAKRTINEAIVLPAKRPDLFCGPLLQPPKGLLLFGPPGTGKTMICKVIASQLNSTFFNVSASSLTSKWIGEGEKLVRCLFELAKIHEPSVVFIDEVDSLLSQRSDGEHDSSRRMKTEFLVQMEGTMSKQSERVLFIGATNRPQEIDEAARRRFVKRLYIPLPEKDARLEIVKTLFKNQKNCLDESDFNFIAEKSDNFSGADMKSLCKEAAMCPVREIISKGLIETTNIDDIRPICLNDFIESFCHVKPSVSNKDLEGYLDWNSQFGSGQ